MRSELDRARSGAAAEMKRVILKHQTSHRKVRQQALETEKRLQKELGVKQTELWQQTATIDQWLHETAQQVFGTLQFPPQQYIPLVLGL